MILRRDRGRGAGQVGDTLESLLIREQTATRLVNHAAHRSCRSAFAEALPIGQSVRVMRLETARRFALSLPETTEQPHFEKSSFRVKGKIFATVPVGGKALHVFVGEETVCAGR